MTAPPVTETKRCARCQQVLPLSAFGCYGSTGRPRSWCHACEAARVRSYNADPRYREGRLSYYRAYYQRHKSEALARNKRAHARRAARDAGAKTVEFISSSDVVTATDAAAAFDKTYRYQAPSWDCRCSWSRVSKTKWRLLASHAGCPACTLDCPEAK